MSTWCSCWAVSIKWPQMQPPRFSSVRRLCECIFCIDIGLVSREKRVHRNHGLELIRDAMCLKNGQNWYNPSTRKQRSYGAPDHQWINTFWTPTSDTWTDWRRSSGRSQCWRQIWCVSVRLSKYAHTLRPNLATIHQWFFSPGFRSTWAPFPACTVLWLLIFASCIWEYYSCPAVIR